MSGLAKALGYVARAATSAASSLEAIGDQVPETLQKKVVSLWDDRERFVEGVRELVTGLQGMHEVVTHLSQRVDNLEARLSTVEVNRAARGRHLDDFEGIVLDDYQIPPPPPSLDDTPEK